MSAFEEYRCQEGDTVDLIAFQRFQTHGMEMAILEANPGLASMGPVLPLGLVIKIPVPEVKDRARGVTNIWNDA